MWPENVHVKSPKVAGDRSKWFTLLFLGCGIVILACDTYRCPAKYRINCRTCGLIMVKNWLNIPLPPLSVWK